MVCGAYAASSVENMILCEAAEESQDSKQHGRSSCIGGQDGNACAAGVVCRDDCWQRGQTRAVRRREPESHACLDGGRSVSVRTTADYCKLQVS